ncbi:hypothetical protein QOZ98_001464 [Planomicrobium stackebrandtii]|uniref:Uncharacterized protein n=1 Tax=Planomicrobium stackebrandtii TaxID=253160 RepID=A0ABU0GTL5_9BACL|nr:hypothetical protein [Planomicrobium stackebrandtii]
MSIEQESRMLLCGFLYRTAATDTKNPKDPGWIAR